MPNINASSVLLGIDLGTSGLRAHIVQNRQSLAAYQTPMCLPIRQGERSEQAPHIWQQALHRLLSQLKQHGWTAQIEHIIADATSSTVLLGDTPQNALMYDDRRAKSQAEWIQRHAPKHSGAHGASSTLAKVLWLETHTKPGHILHQIDWLNQQLCGHQVATDENNALKLGYDAQQRHWPDWVQASIKSPLPQVVPAGTLIGQVSETLHQTWGFQRNTQVYSGTTDSLAAFLASGAHQIGDAVSSLGSTLAIKMLTPSPLFAPEYGLYSHRLQNKWLVGGASNSGGAVILHHFTLDELEQLLPQIDSSHPTGLTCYPLINPGERFPIADPNFMPQLPQTSHRQRYLHALIEGLVDIEKRAYERLNQLGAAPIKRIFTLGGGTQNSVWMQLRQQSLAAPLAKAQSQDAAFGVTRLLY